MSYKTFQISDGISLIQETHVANFMRCNIWHIKGQEFDLLIDTGMGLSSLKKYILEETSKPIKAIVTHSHFDHCGSLHEFNCRLGHKNEEDILEKTLNDKIVFSGAWKEIESIDADIVWVSLGFPKQEIFIDHVFEEGRPNINYVGIGGVFEWVAGTKKKAPEWVADIGLEWLLRLVQDPKRLYKRYLIDNTLFMVYFFRQLLFRR